MLPSETYHIDMFMPHLYAKLDVLASIGTADLYKDEEDPALEASHTRKRPCPPTRSQSDPADKPTPKKVKANTQP